MGGIDDKLKQLGLILPPPPTPGGCYKSSHQEGHLLFLAGAISVHDGQIIRGQVGADLTVEQGYQAARACVMQQLAVLQNDLGTLDRVKQIVSVNGYVNGISNFSEAPAVINGASELLVALFGESGRHVRAAVTVCGLPKGAAVEVQMIVSIAN